MVARPPKSRICCSLNFISFKKGKTVGHCKCTLPYWAVITAKVNLGLSSVLSPSVCLDQLQGCIFMRWTNLTIRDEKALVFVCVLHSKLFVDLVTLPLVGIWNRFLYPKWSENPWNVRKARCKLLRICLVFIEMKTSPVIYSIQMIRSNSKTSCAVSFALKKWQQCCYYPVCDSDTARALD